MTDLERFEARAHEAISKLRSATTRSITLIHHDDADGLASGALTKACLEREGFEVKTLCLEKVYPEVVESLHERENALIFYTDIGSSHADFISMCNRSRNLVTILDHHDPRLATDQLVYDLNLEHFGFRGESDFSGATCCYLFARELSDHNVDLSYIALIGSCELPEGFVGLNKLVLDEALKVGVVEPVGKRYKIKKFGAYVDDLFSAMQILGAVGYYVGGPELGIRACLEGMTPEIKAKLEELEAKRKSANKRMLAILYRKGLNETGNIQWFDSGNLYVGMGTKVIGTFCSFLSYQARLIKPDKYIFGMIRVPPEIPGWGKLRQDLVKVSVRLPRKLRGLVDAGRMPNAFQLLAEASKELGGVADGHAYAANVTLPADKARELIEKAEEVLSKRKG